MNGWPYLLAAWIAFWGLYGIVTSRHMVHLTICLGVFQSASYVLLLAIGFRRGGLAPIFKQPPLDHPAGDPILQALVLTDIVVALTSAALLLALTIEAKKRFGTVDPGEIRELRG